MSEPSIFAKAAAVRRLVMDAETVQRLTLAEFLLARIAEDEAIARTIQAHGRWEWREFPAATYSLGDDNVWAPYFSIDLSAGTVFPVASVVAHIARHDPARVLAECEAKRAIVEVRQTIDAHIRQIALTDHEAARDARNTRAGLDVALKALALPYADHESYREEWKP